jgi:trigger factor
MRQQFQTYGGGTSGEVDLPDNLFTEQAERRVAVGLVINEIVATANLAPDPEKVRARIETLAAGYAEPQQVINYYMSNDEQRQQIEMSVLEDQVVAHILKKAGVEEVPSTYNEILSGQAVTAPRDHEVPPEGAEARSDDPAGAAETADSNAAE